MIYCRQHPLKVQTSHMILCTGMNSWSLIMVVTVHQKEGVAKAVQEVHHLVVEWVVAPWE